jgi:hypothetical protein
MVFEKDHGTARVSERRAFRTRPWRPPVRERHSQLLWKLLRLSRDSACCRGAPTGGNWGCLVLSGSRRGCCKLSKHSAQALVCRRLCHEVDMIGPNMSSKQFPPAARTNLLQASQHQLPTRRIQHVGLLAHSVSCSLFLVGVSFGQRGAKRILSHRDGPSLAGEPSSVANKCNELRCRLRRSLTVAVL